MKYLLLFTFLLVSASAFSQESDEVKQLRAAAEKGDENASRMLLFKE